MAITWQSAGAIAAGTGVNLSVAYPTGIVAGDLLLCIQGGRPATANTAYGNGPIGWTEIVASFFGGGYGTTLGADTGNMFVRAWYTVALGGESGTFNLTGGNTSQPRWAQVHRLSNATGVWELAAATGGDTSAGSVSVTFSSNPGVTAGDYIVAAFVIPTDVTTPAQFSASAFSQTGVTFGTVTEVGEPDTSVGNDLGGLIVRAAVSSGTGTANPVLTATAGGTTTNVRGPAAFIRIREGAAPPTNNFWRLTMDGTGQSLGDTLDEALYVADPLDSLNGLNFTENTAAGGLLKLVDLGVAQGTRAMSCQTTASAAPFAEMSESGWTNPERIWSTYLHFPVDVNIPANIDFIQLREAATLHRCRLTTARQIAVVNGSTAVATSTTVLDTETLYRITFRVVFHGSTGVLEAKIFAGHSDTPIETVTASSQNTGTTLPTNVRVGIPIAVDSAGPFRFDDIWCNEGGTDLGQSGRVVHVNTQNTGNAASVSSRVVNVPTGVRKGDVIFVFLGQWQGGATPVITPPAGFTQIYSWQSGDGNARNSLWYKRLTAADTGTYTWTFDTTFWTTCHAIALRNVIQSGDPVDTRETNVVGTFGTVTDMTLSTGVADGDGALWMVYNDTAGTHTPPTGFTELVDNDCATSAFLQATSSSVTATAGTCSTSSPAGAALVIAKANGYVAAGATEHFGVANLTATHTLSVSGLVEYFAAVGLSATHALTVAGIVSKLGSVSLSATHTLSAAGDVQKVAVAALTASHTLTSSGTRSAVATAPLTATHTLTAAATTVQLATANLTATHTLTTTGVVSKLGTASLTATHTLTSAAVVSKNATAALTAAHTLTASAIRTAVVAAALTATHTLVAAGTRDQAALANLTATHILTASTIREQFALAALTAIHTLTAEAVREQLASVTLTATHTLSATGDVTGSTSALLTAEHTLTISAVVSKLGVASLTATHSLTASATVEKLGTVTMTATHTLTVTGVATKLGTINLTATHALTVSAVVEKLGGVSMTATHTLTTSAVVTRNGVAALSATHTLSSAAVVTRLGVAALVATHTLLASADGFTEHQGTVAMTATHTLGVAAVVTGFAVASLTATSTLTVAGQIHKIGDVAMSVTHNLNVIGVVEKVGAASLTATHVLTVTALRTAVAIATLSATHTLTATAEGITVHQGVAALVATHTLASLAIVSKLAVANMTSAHTLSVAGTIEKIGAASLSAVHLLSATADVQKVALAALAASHSLTVAAQMTAVAVALLQATHVLTAGVLGSRVWVRHPSTGDFVLADVLARTGVGPFVPAEIWVRVPPTGTLVRL